MKQHLDAIIGHFGSLREMEEAIVQRAIEIENGNLTKTARRLGIGRATIYRHLERIKSHAKRQP